MSSKFFFMVRSSVDVYALQITSFSSTSLKIMLCRFLTFFPFKILSCVFYILWISQYILELAYNLSKNTCYNL